MVKHAIRLGGGGGGGGGDGAATKTALQVFEPVICKSLVSAVPAPLQSPCQPEKFHPAPADAVKVTAAASEKSALQVLSAWQLSPPVVLCTAPSPVTVTVSGIWGATNERFLVVRVKVAP